MNWGREEGVLIEFWEERTRILKSSERTVLKTWKVRRTFKTRKGERNQRSWGKNENYNAIDLKRKRR